MNTRDDVSGSTEVRSDLGVPVLIFQTETDVNAVTRQVDTATYRLWEVAGTAHFDAYGGGLGLMDTGDGEGAVRALQALRNPIIFRPNKKHKSLLPEILNTQH